MQLIGMLDSPYVRRVAIGLQLLGLHFEHRSLSVFRDFDAFARINPVVKAPTLVCDDGGVLIDSTLILDHAQRLSGSRRKLVPDEAAAAQRELRLTGLALAACEKSIQIVYERTLRPGERQHRPWLDRVGVQLQAACAALENELAARPLAIDSERIGIAGISVAVAWHFIDRETPDCIDGAAFAALGDLSRRAEALPEFVAAAHGAATFPVAD